MGIYIKNVFEMPKSCGRCIFVKQRETSLGTFGDCPFIGTVIGPSKDYIEKRHPGCPLNRRKSHERNANNQPMPLTRAEMMGGADNG